MMYFFDCQHMIWGCLVGQTQHNISKLTSHRKMRVQDLMCGCLRYLSIVIESAPCQFVEAECAVVHQESHMEAYT